ncbi:MAG: hypothetical protein QOH27_4610, partial [Mycobacterium sp.]|nr:hypothetical protein [Mycobacterium sp.]
PALRLLQHRHEPTTASLVGRAFGGRADCVKKLHHCPPARGEQHSPVGATDDIRSRPVAPEGRPFAQWWALVWTAGMVGVPSTSHLPGRPQIVGTRRRRAADDRDSLRTPPHKRVGVTSSCHGHCVSDHQRRKRHRGSWQLPSFTPFPQCVVDCAHYRRQSRRRAVQPELG